MLNKIKKSLFKDINEDHRNKWLAKTLTELPEGLRILDAGAGQLKNKAHCTHLKYVSQDFCQYQGSGDGKALQTGTWDTSKIDIVCDCTDIPEPAESFDAILCSEVLEHIPDPLAALREFKRLLKPGGKLILTAPFASLVHFAPYHFCTGFSRYWYEHHLPKLGFRISELSANGDWFDFCHQEAARTFSTARKYNERFWFIAFIYSVISIFIFKLWKRSNHESSEMCCFGWHCIAELEKDK